MPDHGHACEVLNTLPRHCCYQYEWGLGSHFPPVCCGFSGHSTLGTAAGLFPEPSVGAIESCQGQRQQQNSCCSNKTFLTCREACDPRCHAAEVLIVVRRSGAKQTAGL